MADRTFVKFTFFALDPSWRRRSAEERARDKAEFQAACEDFGEDRSLRAYSTVGTRGDTDLMLLSQSPILGDIHTFHVVLGQSGLASWASTPYSYLAMTKPSPYSESESRPEICISDRKYLFVYPFEKKREWYGLPIEERQRIMANHIEVGRRYPEISRPLGPDLVDHPRQHGIARAQRRDSVGFGHAPGPVTVSAAPSSAPSARSTDVEMHVNVGVSRSV